MAGLSQGQIVWDDQPDGNHEGECRDEPGEDPEDDDLSPRSIERDGDQCRDDAGQKQHGGPR
jgi:hypothetical protein